MTDSDVDPKPSLNLGEGRVERIDDDRGQTNRSEWGRVASDLRLSLTEIAENNGDEFDAEACKEALRRYYNNQQRTLAGQYGPRENDSEAES